MKLGILGGMGPAATCDLYRKITENTQATKDQEHIHVVIDSNAQIPDRTAYICGTGEDPRIEMIRSAIRLEMMGADYIVMPCNTAHYFYDDIKVYCKVPVLHMIRETAAFLKKNYPDDTEYLLLATEGTYTSGIYKNAFMEYGLDIIEPEQDDKKVVMNWIYNVKSGNFNISASEVKELINRYAKNKEMNIILGCTELPLMAEKVGAPEKYIDPELVLAKRCVEIFKGKE
ncbi:cysteate racemase [Lutispora thermophila]|uniref:Aspartate racemase n=1 Tax=Lutispora thermophila DSM 19022 TaxID=1122184 RepID=A0A1M6H843_9FIRM|nr:amino acid racemase [Lutispora thermophila]SHJ18350.1 aspartate racemase [Lutispora thermophila DSM 19022]